MQLLMGLQPKQALNYVAWTGVDAEVRQQADPQIVQEAMQGIHEHLPLLWAKAVQSMQKRRRARRQRAGVTMPRINIGDLVLVAETVCPHKLRMKWTGPHQVVGALHQYCYQGIHPAALPHP